MNSGQGIPIRKRSITSCIKLLLALVCALITQTSCQKKTSTSIVIIAVDSLSISDVSCAQKPAARSGLALLCEDSLRFTHAYTPSPLSVPAMASLLTGYYPFQHGLHHNGSPGLPSTYQTVAELALEKKYRTGFFSGGAPIFRKTGLNQGFEVFDDGFVPNLDQIFKPFKKNIDSFDTWLHQEVKGESFIAYFYVPDLNFIDTTTISITGETRSRTFESQLEEFDAQLLRLIKILKRKDQWRETLFVFTGLNGRIINPRQGELAPLNVFVESTQVPLFIKPPQKVRDSSLQWTIDRNVSLVDVGATLFEMIGGTAPVSNGSFPTYSLMRSLFKIEALPPEDRLILMESGWAQWHKMGNLRAAVVNNQDYLVFDQKPKYFNLLTDRLQINPRPLNSLDLEKINNTGEILLTLGYGPFQLSDQFSKDKFSIPYLTWIDPLQVEILKKSLLKAFEKNNNDEEIQNWLATMALETKDVNLLKTLALQSKNSNLTLAMKLQAGLEEKTKDVCWSLTNLPLVDSASLKNCPDSLFRDLIAWIKADSKEPSKEVLKSRFAKAYQNSLVDRKILKTNMAFCEIWDVRPDLILRPSHTDLFLSRPENQTLKMSVLRSLPHEEEAF